MNFSNKRLIQFLKDIIDVYDIQSFEELYVYLEEIDFEKLDKLDYLLNLDRGDLQCPAGQT